MKEELNERELLLLAYLEGDLTGAEKARAEALLAEDAAMMGEYRQLRNTVLVPETATVYKNKAALKKPVPAAKKVTLRYVLWPAAVAASIVLAVLFYAPQNTVTEGGVAATDNATTANAPVISGTEDKTSIVNEKIHSEKKVYVAIPQPKDNGVKVDKGITPVEEVEVETQEVTKELIAATTLQSKGSNTPGIFTPKQGEIKELQIPLSDMAFIAPDPTEKRGLFARVGDKIGNLVDYLQKPRVNIEKQEDNKGKDYWAITLETEKYEWEGRLFTSR
ncbi:MAG: hypothetical protein F9K23_01570 [Bacteroidetes bacterium]|nr:MAG: hypothetical protein F9K23_01570 [Bacteroidota bacterium]